MDTILIFVVLPLATIIFSIALQKLLECPILVAAIVFAVFLILTYTVFGTDFLIAAIIYALLAFVAAFLTCLISRLIRRLRDLEGRGLESEGCDNSYCSCARQGNSRGVRSSRGVNGSGCNYGGDNDDESLLTISSRCGNGSNTDLLTISAAGASTVNNNGCGCNGGNNNNGNDSIVVNAEIVPTNNGRSGCFRGAFRRRG